MHYKRTFLRRLVPAALVAAPILLMAACASIDCAMTTAVGCRYALRGDTVHDTLTILAVRPGSSDSVLVNRLVQPQAFTIPMSYGADRDQLVFQLTDTLGTTRTDTVTVFKANDPHFESVDCPARFFHTLTEVTTTHHAIDSIVIAHPNIDYDEKENLLIYFHPRR